MTSPVSSLETERTTSVVGSVRSTTLMSSGSPVSVTDEEEADSVTAKPASSSSVVVTPTVWVSTPS